MESETTVCVTGAAGYIGSWLVMRLLVRGYVVKATVRDPDNLEKVKHLLDLPKAKTHLTLWKADIVEEGSFDEAIQGCTGVFHVATPVAFSSKDPENEMIKPTVKRLIYTSSTAAIRYGPRKLSKYDESS